MRENYNKRSNTGNHSKKEKMSKLNLIGKIISIIQLIVSALLIFQIYRAQVLPELLVLVIAVIFAALWIVCRLLMGKAKKKFRFYVGMILAIVISFAMCVGNIFLLRVSNILQGITSVEYETTSLGVYVLEDDPAQTMNDVIDYDFGILEKQGRKDTNNAIAQINEELETEITTEEYEDAMALAQGLLDGQCGAIIMNEAFLDVISETEGYESFEDEIREIDSYQWKTMVTKEREEDVAKDGVFTVFISGIDVAGDISTKSRSDVNILAVVNRNTHQIQLISTPRDYYVPLSISDGVKDKLTHAGIYGVDVSMDTLSMLYDTDIDYYFRINFSGFRQLIDALGGITVNSDYEFEAGGYHFYVGENRVNGEQALSFARERHAFAEGDRQRGRNQMAVISGVISKMQSLAILQDFSGFMEGVQGSFESDIPYELLAGMVKDQLSGAGSWNISSYSVDGTGASASTYSMSQKLYVMEPDMSTVEQAKQLIQAVKNGGGSQ